MLTFLPFTLGCLLYAGYSALLDMSFVYIFDNYVSIMEHGFAVGALSTVVYVWYEQFIRNKKPVSATEGVIATLIDGYVPDGETERLAKEIAHALECDVTGGGANKIALILNENRPETVTEKDITLLSRLIIETLAHLTVK